MPAVKIAGVVLAAGASTRLGRPKQSIVIDGETLVERTVRVVKEAGLYPVIVVVADETMTSAVLNCSSTQIQPRAWPHRSAVA